MNNERRWRMAALLTGVVAAALITAGPARADAGGGEFLGYRLGDRFSAPADLAPRPHVAGPLVYDLAVERRDHGVESMSLFVSPQSAIIGSIFGEWYFPSKRAAAQFASRYLDSLGRRYAGWVPRGDTLSDESHQLSVEVQRKPRDGEYWPSAHKYRVAVSLIYAPDSLARGEWMAIVNLEADNLELAARQ